MAGVLHREGMNRAMIKAVLFDLDGTLLDTLEDLTDGVNYALRTLGYPERSLEEVRAYCLEQVDTLWDEVKRFDNPHTYYVDLSQKLWDIKYGLLKRNNK